MPTRIHVVAIDVQNDFVLPDGALSVPGALEDTLRTADMIRRGGSRIDQIHVTLDSHNVFDIAHPSFWKDSEGNNPAPFSVLTAADVRSGSWTTTRPSLRERALNYLDALETGGRYPHVIWPPHCLIGTTGFALHEEFASAVHEWSGLKNKTVHFVSKGSNPFTEHFSAVRAEVPDPSDPSTQVNTGFIQMLEQADEILLVGQARSHCVANTMRDIADSFSDESMIRKVVCLTDAMSDVGGFENLGEAFMNDLTARGMRTATTADYFG